MAFLKNIQAAAGSPVNFTGFLFATSGAAVLTAISFLSESIESYIERYSQKQIEKILANDRLSQNYLIKKDNIWAETAVEVLEKGDHLKIRYGEAVPVDGILKTDAIVMRDQLTGEADEINLNVGEKILAGTIIKGRNGAEVQAIAVGSDTSLAKIRQIAAEVAQNKSNAATQVEKFAKWFSPIITGLSLLGFLYGAYVGSYFYIIYSLSLVFVFTPCALKLSVPALTATFLLKFSKKKKMFIKNFSAFENAKKIKAVFFDKTGTLVSHEKKIIDQKIITDAELVYALVEKMTQSSNHPVSKFFNQEAQKNWQGDFTNPRLSQMAEIEGQGFVAQWKEKNILFGNEKLLTEQGFSKEHVAQFGEFSNYLVIGQNIAAGFLLEGKLRPDAIETVSALQKTGRKIFILSGDRKEETKRVARLLNIPEEQAFGQLSDDEKMEKVATYKKKVGLTMFVGDGINDAKALAQADLGVAWNAQNLAAENADIIAFEDSGLKRVTEVFEEQKRYNRLLIQNIFFPLITNSALLFTIVSGTFSSLLLSIGGPLLSGFTLPIAFLIHESVSFMAAGNSVRGYLNSPSLVNTVRRLFTRKAAVS
jgi:P-type E1-E2 ATPase